MLKTKNHRIFSVKMQSISLDRQCLKNCLQMVLNGKKNMLKFKEDFIKHYDENSDKGYIFEVDAEYPKIYMISVVIYHFYLKQ